jgi:subtilisin family serine protease
VKRWLAWLLGLCLGMAALPSVGQVQAQNATPWQLLVLIPQPPPHFRPDAGYGGAWDNAAVRKARQRLAERLARTYNLQLDSAWSMERIGLDCFVMTAAPGTALEPLLQRLAGDPRIAWAQRIQRFQAQAGADPLYALQPTAQAWHLADLHRAATGQDVRVAVIDSGVDGDHPDLRGQVQRQADFVDGRSPPENHGTAVAGLIAAREGDGVGIAGIAPLARLLALRACRESTGDTWCNSLSLALALHDAITHDAQVINLSLSGPTDRLLQRLLDAALERRCAIVAAADPKAADGGFPASHPGVVAVAAQPHLRRDVVTAPGRDVLAPLPGARWQPLSGDSYAAAQVSGLFALLRQLRGNAAGRDAATALVRTPAGEVDACATLALAHGRCVCNCPTEQDASAGRATVR